MGMDILGDLAYNLPADRLDTDEMLSAAEL
jgi:hypothetical protein